MSTLFYLGPILTKKPQRAYNKQKLPQMTFLGLFGCKQTFSQNVAKFRLTEGLLVPQPSTYEKWQICPLFLSPPNTYEGAQRAYNKQKLPQMTFLGLFRCKQTFSQNVAKFRLIQPSTYGKWHICPLFSISAQYVRVSLKEPLMYKSCPK